MQTITAATLRPFSPAVVMMRGAATAPRRPTAEDGVRRTFSKGEELYAEGDAAEPLGSGGTTPASRKAPRESVATSSEVRVGACEDATI